MTALWSFLEPSIALRMINCRAGPVGLFFASAPTVFAKAQPTVSSRRKKNRKKEEGSHWLMTNCRWNISLKRPYSAPSHLPRCLCEWSWQRARGASTFSRACPATANPHPRERCSWGRVVAAFVWNGLAICWTVAGKFNMAAPPPPQSTSPTAVEGENTVGTPKWEPTITQAGYTVPRQLTSGAVSCVLRNHAFISYHIFHWLHTLKKGNDLNCKGKCAYSAKP